MTPGTHREVALALRTGTGLACIVAPEAPSVGTLVLAHGAGNDHCYSFEPFFEAAIARGLAVVTFDLPGHGAGGTSRLALAHVDEDFAEAAQAARRLAPDPERPWLLVGNSLGGALALHAVAAGRLAPDGVVTIATPTRLEGGLAGYFQEARSLLSPSLWAYRRYVRRWHQVLPAFGAFRRREFPVRTEGDPMRAYASLLNRGWPASLATPLLVIQGERDGVARTEDTLQAIRGLRNAGADVAWSLVPEVGHLDVMLDARVIARVLAWCEARLADHQAG